MLAEPEHKQFRSKKDKQFLEDVKLGDLVNMTFGVTKTEEFKEKFDEDVPKDMMKLEAKKVPKVSRAERRKRQKEREEQLQNVLALKQAGAIDADELLKVASEGGEIEAAEVTQKD